MDHTVLKIKRIKKCIKCAGDSENNKTTMMCSYPESLLLPFLLMFLLHVQGMFFTVDLQIRNVPFRRRYHLTAICPRDT